MINYTYRNLILCEIFSLTNVNFSTFILTVLQNEAQQFYGYGQRR